MNRLHINAVFSRCEVLRVLPVVMDQIVEDGHRKQRLGKKIRPTLIKTKSGTIAKKSQNQVKILGFYCPSRTRPVLIPGIRICSQKWSQFDISIDYGYISQVKILYKVKFSKLEICQSDCRFKILAKNCVKKVSFFFQNFD